ncbi:hypothetical protein BCO18430_00593 [Burkholderia contaminans]|uniref:hypothetical protein n=1 Tax=Burkholderia contaminans TaxID=488447 RepID=UPI001452B645|nr:hypothetical protein [Burkholderia contaminans]VWC58496.1 hypothetical protein BCO18430_00593 [Burkholderia contaminans]
MKNKQVAALAGVTFGILAGCSTQPPEQTDLAKAWSQKLAPYDLVTIFPPRTTIEPGDLYVLCANPSDDAKVAKFAPIFVTSLEGFQERLGKFFTSRLELPANANFNKSAQIFDISDDAKGIRPPTKWTRLGLASFPEIFQIEGSTTTAGASAPTGFAIFGLGGQKKSLQTYVLSMPAAEWAGLPWLQAQEQAATSIKKLTPLERAGIASLHHTLKNRYENNACGSVRLAYVQEVFYARHMTLSFGTNRSAAVNAQARLYINPNQARYNVLQAASQPAASAPAPASVPSDAKEAQAVNEMNAAQAGASAANNLGVPGGSVSSAYVSDDGMAFDYSFVRPVAVGAKVIDLRVDTNDIIVSWISPTLSPADFGDGTLSVQHPLPANTTLKDLEKSKGSKVEIMPSK